jgi:hypothetical protein
MSTDNLKTIVLHGTLPGGLDLADINKRLHARTVQLDWGSVVSAPPEHLAVLLKGLDLSEHADVLGIEGGMSDTTADAIVRFFNEQKRPGKRATKKHVEETYAPQVWIAPDSPVNAEEQGAEAAETEPARPDARPSRELPPRTTQLQVASHYALRERLESIVVNDLLGPVWGEEEELDVNKVREHYLVGMLAPVRRSDEPDLSDDEMPVEDDERTEEGKMDVGAPLVQSLFPSSFGMTFCVSGDADVLLVRASWGHYERVESESIKTETGQLKMVWRRRTISETSGPIKLVEGFISRWDIHPEFPGVYVEGTVRRQDDEWLVSLFLVNGQDEPERLKDEGWLFQPELSVESADSARSDIFVRKPRHLAPRNTDPLSYAEEKALRMLYRKHVEFAVGHGVSVHAIKSQNDPTRAVRVATTVVPKYEAPKVVAPKLQGVELDMKALAEDHAALESLLQLPKLYDEWINGQEAQLKDSNALLDDYHEAAKEVLENCRRTRDRIDEGARLVLSDPRATEAFQFMNRAMWQQRVHSLYSEQVRIGEKKVFSEIDQPKNRTWYPFQLAFILLNLPGITDLHHSERGTGADAVADLLWFPTGGGKTESYLGLTAYTLAIRRLQGLVEGRSGEHGVAVLMRYTLRLLTLQQFQRATALICACEAIRRETAGKGDDRWGKEPFRLGLWVGSKTTPNKTDQADDSVKQARGQYQPGGIGSPHQLTNCPWCGSEIDPGKHIKVDPKGTGRTVIYCGDTFGECLFSARLSPGEGLPALVVDEEIYRKLPALLIATVDKFAAMPWEGAVQMLYGQVNGLCERHGFRSPEIADANTHPKKNSLPAAKTVPHGPLRPPDLIIQDELHLISGPLGTMTGLYETAVDKLASWEVRGRAVRPKVIASTATIRQARDQIHGLFLRKVQVFPPQGLNVENNFFSEQKVPGEENPGRRYLGICAPGRRMKAALIRVYTAMLAAAQRLYEDYGALADPWMTTVGYFSSLRELGGTRRLVEDDIRSALRRTDRRGLAQRFRLNVEELTSRRSSVEIPDLLDLMGVRFDPVKDEENDRLRNAGQPKKHREPVDVLLATNMLSVGVDVRRLGAMIVAGQPKNTAEYIQATSRVGRLFPGLVVTVYNWSRPRDLSHYERFEHYHDTFYQHVEALSLTPFSSGAVERGLAALLVSLVRLYNQDFNENTRAGAINRTHPVVQAAVDAIISRAWAVSGDAHVRNQVKQEIENKIDLWLDAINNMTGGTRLGYQKKKDGLTLGLLKEARAGRWEDFTCLRSLRNVEPTVGLVLSESAYIDYESGRAPEPFIPGGKTADE